MQLDEETLDPSRQTQPDSKEGCYIGCTPLAAPSQPFAAIHPAQEAEWACLGRRQVDPSEYEKPLHGPNQFPSEVRGSALCISFRQAQAHLMLDRPAGSGAGLQAGELRQAVVLYACPAAPGRGSMLSCTADENQHRC